ncbi:MAG: glycosyltransferase family 39 protein [Bacteroidetes bacterium]|nr:glycosyltransferase family 39 protein [Bacteroidota bacterium]
MFKKFYQVSQQIAQKPNVILFGLLLIAFISRLIYLTYNPVGHDEPFSIFHAQMNPSEIVKTLKGGNNPPLYELFLHYWIRLFGIGAAAVRIPSLVFSVLNVWVVFLITKRHVNLKTAVLASLITIFSSYHIYFAHEARVYALFSLLTAVSFYLILRIIYDKADLKLLISIFLVYAALIYSHYLGVVVVLLQVVLVTFLKLKTLRQASNYFLVLAALLVSFSFYIPEFYYRMVNYAGNGGWLKPVENLGNLHHMIYLFSNNSRYLYLVVTALFWFAGWKAFKTTKMNMFVKGAILFAIIPFFFLVSFSIYFNIPFVWKITSFTFFHWIFIVSVLAWSLYILLKRKKDNSFEVTVFVWFMVPLLVLFSISFFIPLFHDRYLVFISSAFYIGIALIINKYSKSYWFYIVSAIFLFIMIWNTDFRREDNVGVDKTAELAQTLKQDSTKIIICPDFYTTTFLYHYNRNLFSDYDNLDAKLNEYNIFGVYGSKELNKILDYSESSVIFVDANSTFLYPNNGMLDSLNTNFNLAERYEFNESLALYYFK